MEEETSLIELVNSSTVESRIFPKLAIRHIEQIKSSPNARLLYYVQNHEIYMYTYFKNATLKSCLPITVQGRRGHALGVIDHTDIELISPASTEYFYTMLLQAPEPFVFIPAGCASDLTGFCKGAFTFESGAMKGILMDLSFAVNVGVDFIGFKHVSKHPMIYIGFICQEGSG